MLEFVQRVLFYVILINAQSSDLTGTLQPPVKKDCGDTGTLHTC